MRKMKDSGIEWIGEIPESWNVESLKRGVKIEMGQSPSSECYNSDRIGFPFLQGNADFTDKFPIERVYTTEANKFSKAGDLLLSVRAPVGAINISDKEYAIGRGLCSITGNRVKVPFLWYAMEILNRGFDANSTGSTFESINTEDVGDAKIMVPSELEQSRIADYLDKKCAEIDELIASKEKTNELLKERRQSIIYEAVTKGLNPDAPMKDSGIEWIGLIPEHWEVRRLKMIANMQTGTTPKTSNTEYFDGDVNWFTPADFNGDLLISESERKLTFKAIEDGQAHLFKENTIMFVGIGATVGKIAFAQVEASCNQQITAILLKEPSRSKYYAYWLTACSSAIKSTANYTTLPIINNQHLGETQCPYSESIDEQSKIIEFLDSKCSEIDLLILANKATIQKLKEYRQSIIYEAVTGKIEV